MAGEFNSEAMWGRLVSVHERLGPRGLGVFGVIVGEASRSVQDARPAGVWDRLMKLYENLRSRGSAAGGAGKPRHPQLDKFIKDKGIAYPMAIDKDRSVSADLNSNSVPRVFVIKDGFVVWRGDPMFFASELVESWLETAGVK